MHQAVLVIRRTGGKPLEQFLGVESKEYMICIHEVQRYA